MGVQHVGAVRRERAREIAEQAKFPQVPVSISSFADGETRVRLEADVRGKDVCIVQPTSTPTNERLVTLALLAEQMVALDYAESMSRESVRRLLKKTRSSGRTSVRRGA